MEVAGASEQAAPEGPTGDETRGPGMKTTGKQTRRVAQERRLQSALRENLRRRKAQARGRQVATETEGAPDPATPAQPNREPPAGEPDKS